MRYLILTDIHGNLEALDACLADAATHSYDRVLVLGDLVGYGADPNEVVARVQGLAPFAIVRGNHDKVASGLEQADGFNAVARNAALWTLNTLTPEHRRWLAELPKGPAAIDELMEICHGSPFDEDAYIFDEVDARRALDAASRPLCVFGHTHVPVMFRLTTADIETSGPPLEHETHLPIVDGDRYLVNPGAVGQPRDGDPRAAYAIVDTSARHVELFRVEYSIEGAQVKIVKAGLPPMLARRLALGR